MKDPILPHTSLQAGDVLLCYSSEFANKEDVPSGYSHVAIALNSTEILESSGAGVRKTDVTKLLEEYGHISVLRSNDLWSKDRIDSLSEFATKSLGKKFNNIGMKKVPKRKTDLATDEIRRVTCYFEGESQAPSPDRDVYFCSELVVSAFIESGIIEESASIIISPETTTPEDIVKDNIFGIFVGYLIPYDGYTVPISDIFASWERKLS
ncbi:YiiX/YebB-like N1pC/P60 family cysteine hydrolase [Pseudomonas citronellolis]|uniref:YiiX/YebB-like N1pC/P60 family cysteine hydrolase n=1 Tax=Pseudomonas citronellolis TaxID=53408 RepID=UPI0022BA4450|nr:YiiX/YebB-like N1pC/P60 family cysteine hydrolase [Pseudomonas citronellolis]